MINLSFKSSQPKPKPSTSSPPPSHSAMSSTSFSGWWRELKDSTDADLQLMKSRANTINREFENLLNWQVSGADGNDGSKRMIMMTMKSEMDFVKRLQPKITEFRRVYSSPEFSKIVLDKFSGGATTRLNLQRFRNAIVSEVGGRRGWSVGVKEGRWRGGEEEEVEGMFKEWEPIKSLKTRFREFESKSSSKELLAASEVFEKLKNSEFVEKVKLSLKSVYSEPQELKEVPPLDVPEVLANFIKQTIPILDQLGFKRDVCDKMVEVLCNKSKNHHNLRSTSSEGEIDILENETIKDELDLRMASILRSTGHNYEGDLRTRPAKDDEFTNNKRNVAIVTTASLPWMTGTAVNPLFRAAYLSKSAKQNVTLLVPWLCQSDQELVYPNKMTFSSSEEQELYIRNWLAERLDFKADFKISFYPGKFSKERRSILPMGDTTQFISSKEADIAILEEPEHLNWYHHGKRWNDKFNHVVGIVHTNYLEYIKREKNGALQAFFVKHVNNWIARAYCDKVLRLSSATEDLPRSSVCNVHGVNPKFLKVGEVVAQDRERGQQSFSEGAYFLGKMVWAKGYRELIDLLAKHKNDLEGFKLDVYGNGEDAHEVQSSAKKLDLNLNFLKGRDHADDSLHRYKVFINPSVSDVLCTATAEALAMGKFVVCADHPSNEFFMAFPNCLTYKTSEDFVEKVKEALASEPQPLTPEQRYNLSWEAATKRFIEFSELESVLNNSNVKTEADRNIRKSASMPNLTQIVDNGLAFTHFCLTGSELLRLSSGAIPGSLSYSKQHSEDLKLLPPQVERPIYGW